MYTPDSSIIDNRKLKLFEELNKILQEQKVLDIASGYFNLSGFQLVKDEIKNKPEQYASWLRLSLEEVINRQQEIF